MIARERVGKIEVEQVGQCEAMGVDSDPGGGSEGEDEQGDVIAIDLEGALPELGAEGELVFGGFADVETGDEKRGEKDEALGGGDKAEGLIDEVAGAGREMGERHPDEEEAAQGVELGPALELGKGAREGEAAARR